MGVSPWVVDLVVRRFFSLFAQQTGADESLCNAVWITVCRWATVLEVALLLLAYATRNADAGATVGHTCREFVDVWGFVMAGETAGVIKPPFGVVGADVIAVPLCKLLYGLFNGSEKEREICIRISSRWCRSPQLQSYGTIEILTLIRHLPSSLSYWNLCGSQHHSSYQGLVWGQMRR